MRKFSKIILVTFVLLAFALNIPVGANSRQPFVAILIVDDFDRSHDLTLQGSTQLKHIGAQFLEELGQLPKPLNEDIVFELISEFQSQSSEIELPQSGLNANDTCALNLPSLVTDGTGSYVKGGLSDSTLRLPHGIYVADTAREALNGMIHEDEIAVVEVDTNSYRTRDIYNQIIATKNIMEANGTQAFVINMSFAYIPCDPVLISMLAYYDMVIGEVNEERLNGNISEDDAIMIFQAVLKDLVSFNDDSASPVRALIGRLRECEYQVELDFSQVPLTTEEGSKHSILDYASAVPDHCDPLQVLSGPNTIAVAASGNLGEQYINNDPILSRNGMYPLAPALWTSVVSVGALDPAKVNNRANWSNAAEVMMDGLITDLATGLELRGTSFAAPRLSAVIANYMVEQGGVDICNANGQPALAYIMQEQWLEDYWHAGSSITNINLNLSAAESNYCDDIQ